VRSQARSVLKVTAGLCGLAVVLGTILILLRIGTTHAPLADGMASAEVITWLDEDQDGVRDEGEPPFPWVEISPGWRAITNDAGRGSTYEFMAGCARDCWVTSYASVHTPQGYAPTTPTTYRLTAESETYEFGFVRASTGYVPDLPNSPPWCRAFLNRGLSLEQCRTDLSPATLSLALGTTSSPEADVDDVYDVIMSLDRISAVTFTNVELTVPSANMNATCPVATLREWNGRLPGIELFLEKCGQVSTLPGS